MTPIQAMLARNLYQLGRSAPLRDFDDFRFSALTIRFAMDDARERGYIRCNGMVGKLARWSLTDLGVLLVERRIEETRKPLRGVTGRPRRRLVATWLRAYPGSLQ